MKLQTLIREELHDFLASHDIVSHYVDRTHNLRLPEHGLAILILTPAIIVCDTGRIHAYRFDYDDPQQFEKILNTCQNWPYHE